MDDRMTIGQLAELAGVHSKTIRYWEQVGVLPPADRNSARYRVYSAIDVRRLELVRRARELDMALPEVKELVHWASTGACDDLRLQELLHRKLQQVDHRIATLELLKQDLQRLEAHLTVSQKEAVSDTTVLECSPETCTCLGDTHRSQTRISN